MTVRFIFLFVFLLVFYSCSFTKMAFNKYNLDNVKEEILYADNFAYTEDRLLVVNFNGKYFGKKKYDDYHFLLDLNDAILRNNRFTGDSILYLPNSLAASKIYTLDHDYNSDSEEILTIEIRKNSVKNGKYKAKTYPLDGKAEIMPNGRTFSLEIYDEKNRMLVPQVIQFQPKIPWETRGKKYDRISFVLEPTFNRNELNLFLVPPALAADAALVLGQLFIIALLNGN